jgi:hypothetical protein
MASKLEYMLVGFLMAFIMYFVVLGSTNNDYLAVLASLGTMAFWIGTLKVIVKSDSGK